MKILKYLSILTVVLGLFSCEKHVINYHGQEDLPEGTAEFRVHYTEPIKVATANAFDSLFINNKLYANTTNLFTVRGVMPTANKYYVAPAGEINIKCYRGGVVAYDFNTTVKSGKQDIFIHNINEAPVVIDFAFPFEHTFDNSGNAEQWGTDSTAYVQFYNLMYEEYTSTSKVKYSGKIKYQYQDVRTKEWKDVGDYVAFGECSARTAVKVIKDTEISQGSCRIDYRILDEAGNVLKMTNSKGNVVDYSDWWNATIGRVYIHYITGSRTDKTVYAQVVTKTVL